MIQSLGGSIPLRHRTDIFTSIFQYHLKRFIGNSLTLALILPSVILQKNTAALLLILAFNINYHFGQFAIRLQNASEQNTRDTTIS
jgi:hypothetical protein